MKYFIVISSLIALAAAYPTILHGTPAFYTATAPIQSQYHAQDAIGQYSFGYSGGLSAKAETKSFDGVTRGSYTYIDADGKLQSVEYSADSLNGFRAAATNLPRAPVDTNTAPEPVEDTPEVAQARAEHLAAFREAEIRAENAPEEPEEAAEENANGNENENENVNEDGNGNGNDNNDNNNLNGNGLDERAIDLHGAIDLHALTPVTAIASAPITATVHSTLRTVDSPTTSYSYSIDAPRYSYTIAAPAPAPASAPVSTTSYTTTYTAPALIAHAHPLATVHGDFVADTSNLLHLRGDRLVAIEEGNLLNGH